MIQFKKVGLSLTFFTGTIFLMSSCNSGNANSRQEKKQAVGNVTTEQLSTKPVQPILDKAKQDGKVVFLVLLSKDKVKNQKINLLAQSIHAKIDESIVVDMDRDDIVNAAIVNEWQLTGIILPAVFVVSYTGLPITGYSLDDAKEDEIIGAIPSPKTDEAYASINESKPVFLVVTNNSFTDRDMIMANCKAAIAQLKVKPTIVEVNKDDTREQSLLTNFKISPDTKATTVVVINADGQTTDTYNGSVTTGQLIASSKKIVKSACCSSGSSCK
ncbi:MAG: hypothetical protein BGO69_12830 [Bacteroidetes bacterium 46-16]|nr:MAG: hypothetical protein BGO69_12830 [Bacteroidetes bacterium 46-16]